MSGIRGRLAGVLTISTLITACAGGGGGSLGSGGGVVVVPPVPGLPDQPTRSVRSMTPLVAPATTSGDYATIARLRNGNEEAASFTRLTSPDAVRIQVDAATRTYTVQLNVMDMPATTTFRLGAEFGNIIEKADTWPDGSTTSHVYKETRAKATAEEPRRVTTLPNAEDWTLNAFTGTSYNSFGPSYVSFGQWDKQAIILDSNNSDSSSYDKTLSSIFFVYGNRTAAADVPASGTATYAANPVLATGYVASSLHSDPLYDDVDASFTLTADFGARTMSALFNSRSRDSCADWICDGSGITWGISASGSAPFDSSSAFNINVTGTANSFDGSPATQQSVPISGAVDGAFFGPGAAEIGGTYELHSTDGRLWATGAYGAIRTPP